nr:transketolase C-terminal domain-containing protein [uncultured Desulfobacter sp.]
MNKQFQRDAFFDKVYEYARKDRDVLVLVADMSAPSLDKFRADLPSQFINVGIAEQNAIQIASGLAFEGKKVISYAISPFITLRALEQIRVSNGIMGIPITIVGMGTGLSYANDGPTHHLIEDISIMRAIPNINILNITDASMASKAAEIACNPTNTTTYIRLDKDKFENIYNIDIDWDAGMHPIVKGEDYVLLTTGTITHLAVDIAKRIYTEYQIKLKVIDVFKIPINSNLLLKEIAGIKRIFTLEEHFLPGGFGSAVCEILADNDVLVPTTRIGINLQDAYKSCYKYGGRNIIRQSMGIDEDGIFNKIKNNLNSIISEEK